MKIQFPSRATYQLPTRSDVSEKFKRISDTAKDKFQRLCSMDRESLLQTAKENKKLIGGMAGTIATGTLIYSLLPKATENIVDTRQNSTNTSETLNETIPNGNKTVESIVDNVSALTTAGTVGVIALLIVGLATGLCCTRKYMLGQQQKRDALNTKAQATERAAANLEKAKKLEELQTANLGKVNEILADTHTDKSQKIDAIAALNILGENIKERIMYRDNFLTIVNDNAFNVYFEDKEIFPLAVHNIIKTIVIFFVPDLKESPEPDDLKNNLARCFFNNLHDTSSEGHMPNKELALEIAKRVSHIYFPVETPRKSDDKTDRAEESKVSPEVLKDSGNDGIGDQLFDPEKISLSSQEQRDPSPSISNKQNRSPSPAPTSLSRATSPNKENSQDQLNLVEFQSNFPSSVDLHPIAKDDADIGGRQNTLSRNNPAIKRPRSLSPDKTSLAKKPTPLAQSFLPQNDQPSVSENQDNFDGHTPSILNNPNGAPIENVSNEKNRLESEQDDNPLELPEEFWIPSNLLSSSNDAQQASDPTNTNNGDVSDSLAVVSSVDSEEVPPSNPIVVRIGSQGDVQED